MAKVVIQYGSLLFLVSLSMTLASVIRQELHSSSHQILLHRNTRSTDCVASDGSTHADGSTFTLTGSGPCITYLCNSGSYSPNSLKCSFNGQCVSINGTVNQGCHIYTCSMSGNTLTMSPTTLRCSFQGQCVNINATTDFDCTTYTCTLSGNTLTTSPTTTRCKDDNGSCQEPGTGVVFPKTFASVAYNCTCNALNATYVQYSC
ncbi:hypothetical protein ACOMHN_011903 [Nucella lapillus]